MFAAHDIAHAIVGVQQIAGDLLDVDRLGEKRKRHRRVVALLERETPVADAAIEIDAAPIEPRRRAGLEPAPREPERLQRLRQLARRRLAGAAGGMLLAADVDQPVEERAGRDDERAARVRSPSSSASPTTRPCSTRMRPALPKIHSMFGSRSQRREHPSAVPLLVGLRARRPDRRAAAAIEQLELNAGRVDGAPHQAAERVDLSDEMALRGAADRRIARHVRHGVRRQRADRDVAPSRAAAYAASHPACPAPITMTSKNLSCARVESHALAVTFPDTEAREDMPQHIVGRSLACDLLERRRASCRSVSTNSSGSGPPARRRAGGAGEAAGALEQRDVPHVRDRRRYRVPSRIRRPRARRESRVAARRALAGLRRDTTRAPLRGLPASTPPANRPCSRR